MSAILNIRVMVAAAVIFAAFALMVGQSFAKQTPNGTRPGWGYGDKNHVHTGPPGQSVRP